MALPLRWTTNYWDFFMKISYYILLYFVSEKQKQKRTQKYRAQKHITKKFHVFHIHQLYNDEVNAKKG